MKYTFLSLISISLLAAGCSRSPVTVPSPYTTPLSVGTQKIFVELADTEAAREQGLSGRDALTDDQGMLFEFHFPQPSTPEFWMKDMKFALDLVWIRDDKVIAITKNVAAPQPGTPQANLPHYQPPEPITTVLEIRGGWSDSHHLKINDAIHR